MSRAAAERSIAARVHGRYLLSVPEGDGPWPLLVGFHGYGETAEDHLAELGKIPGSEGWILCSVQALHPFYRKTGEVVACWMTSLGREQAIADNLAYVGSVVDEVVAAEASSGALAFAGFSQGVAMAYRAAAASEPAASALVVLAGDVPPEIDGAAAERLPPVLIGRGAEDSWYGEDKMRVDLERLAEAGVEAETCVFEAGHVWTDAFRAAAGEHLGRAFSMGRSG